MAAADEVRAQPLEDFNIALMNSGRDGGTEVGMELVAVDALEDEGFAVQEELAAARLDALPQVHRDYEWASVWIADQVATRQPDVSVHDLQVVWLSLMKQAKMHQHHRIQREELSVREHMGLILRKLHGGSYIMFENLFEVTPGHTTVASMIVSFLAMLELARESLIEITQSEALAPIYVKLRDAATVQA
jgi:segregation and condensation protein A